MRSALRQEIRKSTASSRSMSSTWKTSRRCVNICAFPAWASPPYAISATNSPCARKPEKKALGAGICSCAQPRGTPRVHGACSGPWLLKPRSQASGIGMKKFTRRTISAVARPSWGRSIVLSMEQFIPGSVFHVDSVVSERQILFAEAHAYGAPPLTFHTVEASSRRAHFLAKPGNRATSQPQPKPDAGPRSRSRRYSRRIPESPRHRKIYFLESRARWRRLHC